MRESLQRKIDIDGALQIELRAAEAGFAVITMILCYLKTVVKQLDATFVPVIGSDTTYNMYITALF